MSPASPTARRREPSARPRRRSRRGFTARAGEWHASSIPNTSSLGNRRGTAATRLESGAAVRDQDRPSRVRRDSAGDAAEQQVSYPVAAVGAEHDQTRVLVVGKVDDCLPGWRGFDGQALRPEPGGVGKRGSLGRGLLGRIVYILDLGRVESEPGGGDEPDIERLPGGEEEGLAPRRELAPGLVDRELGQLRAVVGEHDWSRRGYGRLCGHGQATSWASSLCGWRLRTSASNGG